MRPGPHLVLGIDVRAHVHEVFDCSLLLVVRRAVQRSALLLVPSLLGEGRRSAHGARGGSCGGRRRASVRVRVVRWLAREVGGGERETVGRGAGMYSCALGVDVCALGKEFVDECVRADGCRKVESSPAVLWWG